MTESSRLHEQLSGLILPGLSTRLGDVGKLTIDANDTHCTVAYVARFPIETLRAELIRQVRATVAANGFALTADPDVSMRIDAVAVQRGLKPLPGVANIIAVASGKGGVGKSTTAVNLALALHLAGARVGVLDADIYGPSQPRMLGIPTARPESPDGKTLLPLEAHGLQAMSAGFLVDERQPMVWRGPMVTSALNQILLQTAWDRLDYLIVDMPPGTGDIQLTLSQRAPVAGAVIVTTPQDIALLDARKGLAMFRKVGINVLGVIENMSTHICSSCGHEEAVFGSGGAAQLAADEATAMLGQLPLDGAIREAADGGRPSVVAEPEGAVAQRYVEIALGMASALAAEKPEHSHKFPEIVIETDA